MGCSSIWPWFVGFFPFFHTVVGGDLVRLPLIFFGSTVDVDVVAGGCGVSLSLSLCVLLFVVAEDLVSGWWW